MISKFAGIVNQFRNNSVIKYGFANLFPRSIAILTAVVFTPIAIKQLGVNDYGLWSLAILIPNLVSSPDLGITYGIVNEMSRVFREEGNLRSQRERLLRLCQLLAVISFGWLLLGTVGLIWYSFGANRTSNMPSSYEFSVLLLGLLVFILGIPASLWGRVQLAQERGHEYFRWEGIGKTIGFIGSLVILITMPNVYVLIIVFLLPSVLTAYLNARYYIIEQLGSLSMPSWNLRKSIIENRAVFASGKYFLAFQITFLIGTAIDPFIVNALLSTKDVAYLSIARRPFDALPLAVTLFSTALWPVFFKLNSEDRVIEIKSLLLRILAGSCGLICILSVLIIGFSEPIYRYLSQGKMIFSKADLIWISLQMISYTAILIFNNYANAVDLLKSQMWIQIVAAGVGVFAKVLALKYGGLSLYFFVSSAVYAVFALAPMAWLTFGHIRHRTHHAI
ncbi:lipopolysaccharide biosynthesis protein [Deinococcus yunweiensis]|uniref:lipopolysaccharide biosynthesis protein n=1 Tax=Deinococcus yunweiensis TaxID=367282 RepID=UPI00398EE1BF